MSDQKQEVVPKDDSLDDYIDSVSLHHAPGTPVHIRLIRDRKAHGIKNAGTFTNEDVSETSLRMKSMLKKAEKIERKKSDSDPESDPESFEILIDDFDDF